MAYGASWAYQAKRRYGAKGPVTIEATLTNWPGRKTTKAVTWQDK